jgi:hypothetical protein
LRYTAGGAAAEGVLSPRITALTEEVLRAMLLHRLKTGTVLLIAFLGVLLAGGGVAVGLHAPASRDADPSGGVGTTPVALAEDELVWGKEADGLQAGVGVLNANSIRIGGKATFVVKLRNVGKAAIKVSVWPLSYPGVVDAAGKPVRATMAPMPLFEIIPQHLTVQPAQTVVVFRDDINVAEDNIRDQPVEVPVGVVRWFMIHVLPGKYKATFGAFLLDHPSLSTGAVEFEVKAAKDRPKDDDGIQETLPAKPAR